MKPKLTKRDLNRLRGEKTVATKCVTTNYRGARACLTNTQFGKLFGLRKGRMPKPLGCGSFGCVYPSRDPDKVVKITGDRADAVLMAEAQGIPGIATLYHSHRLKGTQGVLGPYYAMVMEKLRPFPEEAENRWHEVMSCIQGTPTNQNVVEECCEGWANAYLQPKDKPHCPKFAIQMSRTLAALYKRDIGHGDFHAGNVGQDKHGNWKILDMGSTPTRGEPEPPMMHGSRLPKRARYALMGAAGVGIVALFYFLGLQTKPQVGYVSMTAAERGRIMQLAPDARAAYEAFLYAAAAQGLRIYTGRTQGNVTKTQAHVAAGRSDATISWHDLTPPRAIDIQVHGPHGLISSPKTAAEIELYRHALRLAEEQGFRQIAFNADGSRRFLSKGAWDAYHIEYRGPYLTVQAAAAATGVRYG